MGQITNIRTAFNYANEGSSVAIKSSNGNYNPESGKVTNFNGSLEAEANDKNTYVGDFSYNEQDNGRVSLNINIVSELYDAASALIRASVADIKEQFNPAE